MTAFNPHEYLNSFNNFEFQLHHLRPGDFNLNRIEKLLDLAGNPGQNLKIVHVAGTKGKGSTCVFLARILQEAGYKVGLYTSPHLFRLNERIRILDSGNIQSADPFKGSISDLELASILAFIRPFAAAIQNEGYILTYFEVLTVAALCYFSKAKADIVILETGLGGRLDATNAIDASIAVITPVSMDHTKILGSTLSKIASEKAGIIKNSNQKFVLAPQEKEAMDVILMRCREFGVHPVLVHPEKYENFPLGLKGKHQRLNAATAIEVINILRSLGFNITEAALKKGLMAAQWPGRFELLRKDPDIIVDCAHNAASAQALAKTIKDEYPNRRIFLVLGISQDKDIAAIVKCLKELATRVFLTQAKHPRAHVFTQAECRVFCEDIPFEIFQSVDQALEKAISIADPQDIIVVTGSVFIVAEAMGFLDNKMCA